MDGIHNNKNMIMLFDSWREKMGLDERSKGKLRPADLLRRKAIMAGKRGNK